MTARRRGGERANERASESTWVVFFVIQDDAFSGHGGPRFGRLGIERSRVDRRSYPYSLPCRPERGGSSHRHWRVRPGLPLPGPSAFLLPFTPFEASCPRVCRLRLTPRGAGGGGGGNARHCHSGVHGAIHLLHEASIKAPPS